MSIGSIPTPSFTAGVCLVFGSMLRMLENPQEYDKSLVGITFAPPLRIMDMWFSGTTYQPRRGNPNALISDDPGLSEKESLVVYGTFDTVFISVFPELPFERSKAAGHMKDLILGAHNFFAGEPGFSSQEELEELKKFSREAIATLKNFPRSMVVF